MDVERFECRACGEKETAILLEMGKLPLANAFVGDASGTEDQFREGLTLVMCEECRLIQIEESVPPERLFGHYLWVTGTSESAKAYARWFAARLSERHRGERHPFLVEIASNDGLILQHCRDVGFEVLGVEPSNLADEASGRGLMSIRAFFGLDAARRIKEERGPADLIVARNVLGHAGALQDFVSGVRYLLGPDGCWIVEVPYAYFLRAEVQYDTVFHEHSSYFTVQSLATLARRFGMKLTDITFVDMNGGSLLCELRHEEAPARRADQAFLDFEALIRLNTPQGWMGFAPAVAAQRASFVGLLTRLRSEGKSVAAYGAAAKFMTMLNYCGVTTELLPVIGDANPRKQGLLCPGVRIPVISPEELMRRNPDYVVIGSWNLKEEIVRLFRERFSYTNRFIVPSPVASVLE